jgi:AcrR family transcriptional regulator
MFEPDPPTCEPEVDAPTPETASERRRLQHREDARRAILDATEALLIERGFEAFSMRRLAERCGYTAPTIYHYFGDKQGLFDTLLDEGFRRMVAAVRRVRRSDDPCETLLTVSCAFVRFGLRNPSRIQLLTAYRPPDPAEPPQSSLEARELVEGPLAELARQGRLLVRDVEEASQCLWIAMHGVTSLLSERPDYEWSKNVVRTSLAAMLRGLVRPAGPGNGRAREKVAS